MSKSYFWLKVIIQEKFRENNETNNMKKNVHSKASNRETVSVGAILTEIPCSPYQDVGAHDSRKAFHKTGKMRAKELTTQKQVVDVCLSQFFVK